MSCNGCTICCNVLAIEAIDKRAHETCPYCDNGCTIYDARPNVCRRFECAWLVGKWREELRPDRCGVMIYNDLAEGYLALMVVEPDEVDPLVMDQIAFIEREYKIKITGIDARAQ